MVIVSFSLYNTMEVRCLFFYAKSRTCSFIVSNNKNTKKKIFLFILQHNKYYVVQTVDKVGIV